MTREVFKPTWRLTALFVVHICFAGVDKQHMFFLHSLSGRVKGPTEYSSALCLFVLLVHMLNYLHCVQRAAGNCTAALKVQF